jgi:uncharacterized repeat protein (TIGR02543 family)
MTMTKRAGLGVLVLVLLLLTGCTNPAGSDDQASETESDTEETGTVEAPANTDGSDESDAGADTGETPDTTDGGDSDEPVAIPQGTVTVTFDGNGSTAGLPPDPITVTSGSTVLIPGRSSLERVQDLSASFVVAPQEPLTQPSPFAFAGWNSQADRSGTTYHPGSSVVLNEDKTLYARWYEESQTKTIQLRLAIDQGAAYPILEDVLGNFGNRYVAGDTIALPDLDTFLDSTGTTESFTLPVGKAFGGWRHQGSGELYQSGDLWTLTESSSTGEEFQLELMDGPLTLFLDYNGGSASGGPESVPYYEYDEIRAEALPEPTRPGFEFGGWSLYGDIVGETFVEMPSLNSTIKAVWTARMSFETYGGTAIADVEQQLDAGESMYVMPINRPNDPTKADYTFKGWFRDESFTQPFSFCDDLFDKSMTLYAKWETVPTVRQLNGRYVSDVDWFLDPPTLEVQYRIPDDASISWEIADLVEGTDYTIDNTLPDVEADGVTYAVSRVVIDDRDKLREPPFSSDGSSTYSSVPVFFRIEESDGTVTTRSRTLYVYENRAPNVADFGSSDFPRSSTNGFSFSLYVWDYETRGENLSVEVTSSHADAQFPSGGGFAPAATIAHTAHFADGSIAPVQGSRRDLTLALNATDPITTTLTITVTDADGANTTVNRTVTIQSMN